MRQFTFNSWVVGSRNTSKLPMRQFTLVQLWCDKQQNFQAAYAAVYRVTMMKFTISFFQAAYAAVYLARHLGVKPPIFQAAYAAVY